MRGAPCLLFTVYCLRGLYDEALPSKPPDDPPDVGPERVAVGVAQRAGDGVGDRAGVVTAVAIGEDQCGSEVQALGAGAGVVAERETTADGLEPEVGACSGIPAANDLLHITKLPMT
jgi:hypothetical protein